MQPLIQPGQLMDPNDTSAQVIVRYKNGYALRFLRRGYEVVEDSKATQFPDRFTADKTAREHGLRADQFEIEPKEVGR